MGMARSVVVSLTIMALFGASMAATYNVGDDAGWTIKGKIDYNKWAEGKNFQIDDVLVFKYKKAMHNVMKVSQQDYESCNAKAPLDQYTSGLDNVTLDTAGHHYFICGIPGHCQVGQKVDIRIPGGSNPTETPAPSPAEITPSPEPSPGSSIAPIAPGSDGGSSATPTAAAGGGESTYSMRTPILPASSATSLYSSSFWLVGTAMLAVFVARSAC